MPSSHASRRPKASAPAATDLALEAFAAEANLAGTATLDAPTHDFASDAWLAEAALEQRAKPYANASAKIGGYVFERAAESRVCEGVGRSFDNPPPARAEAHSSPPPTPAGPRRAMSDEQRQRAREHMLRIRTAGGRRMEGGEGETVCEDHARIMARSPRCLGPWALIRATGRSATSMRRQGLGLDAVEALACAMVPVEAGDAVKAWVAGLRRRGMTTVPRRHGSWRWTVDGRSYGPSIIKRTPIPGIDPVLSTAARLG